MSKMKLSILMGTSVLALAGAGTASAMPVGVFGGGSSLIAPYARQAMDCYGVATDLLSQVSGGASAPAHVQYPGFDYTAATPVQCQGTITPPTGTPVDTSVQLNYYSTGSGTGIQALGQHNPNVLGVTDGSGHHYASMNFAFSETALNANDVLVWNTGANGATNGDGTTNTEGHNEIAGKVVNVMAPGDAPGANQFASPLGAYGKLVQFPVLIAPVDIAFSPTYRKVRNADSSITSYNFHFRFNAVVGGVTTPVLRLNQDAYCKIFNGQITNWNDPVLKALNGNTSLQDPAEAAAHVTFSVPMQIVGRFDSSGTTSVWTRHLAAACASLAGNNYADAKTTLPAGLISTAHYITGTNNQPGASGEAIGKYTLADQSLGVAQYVSFNRPEDVPGASAGSTITGGRVGYVGNDYSMPYNVTYGLAAAVLLQPQGTGSTTTFVTPSPATALISYGTLAPPQSDASGNYVPGNTARGLRTNPAAWVEPSSKTSVLAFPQVHNGYPIVGTTNLLAYTCYADTAAAGSSLNRGKKMNYFLQWFIKQPIVYSSTAGALGLLPTNGLAAVPGPWRTAIYNTFVKPVTTGAAATNGLQLWITGKSNIGTALIHNPSCDSVTGA